MNLNNLFDEIITNFIHTPAFRIEKQQSKEGNEENFHFEFLTSYDKKFSGEIFSNECSKGCYINNEIFKKHFQY